MTANGKIALLVVLVVSLISAAFIPSLRNTNKTSPDPSSHSANADHRQRQQRPQLPPGLMFWPDEIEPHEDIFASDIDKPKHTTPTAPESSEPANLQRDTTPMLIAKKTPPPRQQSVVSLASTIPTDTSSKDIAASEPIQYTVKSGDNLWNIALKLLGEGTRYREIVKLNADKIKGPDDISIGMTLKIPPR
jgi:nucleoid-associated protein YgaU